MIILFLSPPSTTFILEEEKEEESCSPPWHHVAVAVSLQHADMSPCSCYFRLKPETRTKEKIKFERNNYLFFLWAPFLSPTDKWSGNRNKENIPERTRGRRTSRERAPCRRISEAAPRDTKEKRLNNLATLFFFREQAPPRVELISARGESLPKSTAWV